MTLKKKPFENSVGKEENADKPAYSLSHNVFFPFQKEFKFLSYIYFVVYEDFQFGQA